MLFLCQASEQLEGRKSFGKGEQRNSQQGTFFLTVRTMQGPLRLFWERTVTMRLPRQKLQRPLNTLFLLGHSVEKKFVGAVDT